MPTFVSDKGVWHPAKEEIGLTNISTKSFEYKGKTIKPGQPFVYEGPDRAALQELGDQNVSTFGTDFRKDPEFRQSIRNQGFDNVDQYLKDMGYDEEADTKKYKEKVSKVKAHDIPKAVKEIKQMGGGKDYTGNKNNDIIGGFGDERVRPSAELSRG